MERTTNALIKKKKKMRGKYQRMHLKSDPQILKAMFIRFLVESVVLSFLLKQFEFVEFTRSQNEVCFESNNCFHY